MTITRPNQAAELRQRYQDLDDRYKRLLSEYNYLLERQRQILQAIQDSNLSWLQQWQLRQGQPLSPPDGIQPTDYLTAQLSHS